MAFGQRRPATINIDMEEFLEIVADQVKGTDSFELIKLLDEKAQCWAFTHDLYLHFKQLEEQRLKEEGEVPYE